MTVNTCQSCKWFLFGDGNVGTCRRYPPSPFPIGAGKVASYWPSVQLDQLCGEWAVRLEIARDLDGLPPIGRAQ